MVLNYRKTGDKSACLFIHLVYKGDIQTDGNSASQFALVSLETLCLLGIKLHCLIEV